ncbi:TetR/AcrR family transcriptional regulator [Amycolatopsis saalfeldensis]|uniref:DNA-binding transcriptional regulator, AcrR family n=1 Tax=Amycolatopsis saalfeldensis TaxID=394193 RepID=A0A1H8YFR1_9PSEU|nr:TetR/AcrR family transcriptional regulator [Amycolatopsis saalfeldensis]SEP50288.1 DNA-binding transcriptional regulator, AcrR family [Amycolatopsis saalfeldensis]
MTEDSAKERILSAAEELFAESGFEATPTSRIAERAGVPKGLVHYYFRRKSDLLAALVDRLPDEQIEPATVVVPGDLAGSLRRLVVELDRRFTGSLGLSHLLWREADTHHVVREALADRFQQLVRLVHSVIVGAAGGRLAVADVDNASGLLARAVSHRHATARHSRDDRPAEFDGELTFLANALSSKVRKAAPAD